MRSAELIAVEAGAPYTPAVVTAGDVTDRKSIKDCERRLNELEVEIGAAANPEDALAAKQEAAGVETYLKQAKGLGGNPRKETDENELARKAVKAAVTRDESHLEEEAHAALAAPDAVPRHGPRLRLPTQPTGDLDHRHLTVRRFGRRRRVHLLRPS